MKLCFKKRLGVTDSAMFMAMFMPERDSLCLSELPIMNISTISKLPIHPL